MARRDGVDRTTVRNERLTTAKIGNTQRHNEREKDSYVNQDIVPERTPMNVHFKMPTAGYTEMFEQMTKDGTISTRDTKEDTYRYGELIFDVTYGEIEQMGKKTLTGNIAFTPKETSTLKTLAQEALTSRTKLYRLEDALARSKHDAEVWKKRYNSLMEKAAPFLEALERAPRRVMEFLREVMRREPKQSERKPAQKARGKGADR